MPASSEAQRKLMGMALAQKRGLLTKPPSSKVRSVAKGMSEEQLRDFAKKPKTKATSMHSAPYRYHKKKG